MIRAPRIPKSENPAITLANQKRQIDMLLARVEQLTAQVDTYAHDCRKAEEALEAATARIALLQSNISATHAENAQMKGWQACARDVFNIFSRN